MPPQKRTAPKKLGRTSSKRKPAVETIKAPRARSVQPIGSIEEATEHIQHVAKHVDNVSLALEEGCCLMNSMPLPQVVQSNSSEMVRLIEDAISASVDGEEA